MNGIRSQCSEGSANCAVDAGDVTALRILADAHADIDAADCAGRTPVFHAIVGYTDSAQRTKGALEELLSRGADLNIVDDAGQTPLIFCAQHNYPTLLRQLAATGRCDAEISDATARTALSNSAHAARAAPAGKLLLGSGGSEDPHRETNYSPTNKHHLKQCA